LVKAQHPAEPHSSLNRSIGQARRVLPCDPQIFSAAHVETPEVGLWHDAYMFLLALIARRLIEDSVRWMRLLFRSSDAIRAENLFLRRQLALYIERGARPRRIDAATRVSLALLARRFDWRSSLVVVKPATLLRWHRAGWRLLWRLKSQPGRPAIPKELQALIRRMAQENPSWGEERIANELLLKLSIRVSPRTVCKYMPRCPVLRSVSSPVK